MKIMKNISILIIIVVVIHYVIVKIQSIKFVSSNLSMNSSSNDAAMTGYFIIDYF